MIQSFKKEFIEKPTYEFDGGVFYLKLDSSNRIYQFFYTFPIFIFGFKHQKLDLAGGH